KIRLIDVRSDEIDPEARARDGGASEPGERIHRALDARQAVQLQTLLRQARRKRCRMRTITIAPLNRLVRDEPGVAAAAYAVGGGPPSRDVRLILIWNTEREAVEPSVAAEREVKHE